MNETRDLYQSRFAELDDRKWLEPVLKLVKVAYNLSIRCEARQK
jgi:hypothetical protein